MTQIAGWPEGLGLRHYDQLDSTNEQARRLAVNGERGPLWIVAREQTVGRGRRGRAWISQPGNLFATLLTHAPAAIAAELGFAAGLAAADTITTLCPQSSVLLKWPNDILVEGRKAAGILLESLDDDALAIGIGINLAHHPEGMEFPATSLAVAGSAPNPEDVLLRLAGAMVAWYERWRTDGFEPLRSAWLDRAAGLGRPIRARLAEKEMEGVFESLDVDGALLLRAPSGALARITAGEVFF